MIHLALEVLAFLFLCWAGLIVLGIVAAIFDAIQKTFGKLFKSNIEAIKFGKKKADSQGVGLSLCLVEALDQLWTKAPAFYGPESALDSARATESTRFMVGAVGIEN